MRHHAWNVIIMSCHSYCTPSREIGLFCQICTCLWLCVCDTWNNFTTHSCSIIRAVPWTSIKLQISAVSDCSAFTHLSAESAHMARGFLPPVIQPVFPPSYFKTWEGLKPRIYHQHVQARCGGEGFSGKLWCDPDGRYSDPKDESTPGKREGTHKESPDLWGWSQKRYISPTCQRFTESTPPPPCRNQDEQRRRT